MNKKIIGWQIVSDDGKNDIPVGFYSFEIWVSKKEVEAYLQIEKENPKFGEYRWKIVPIYEGDIEEPAFLKNVLNIQK